MGEFILKGEHALDLIQRVTTNDASKLTVGKAQYSCLPNAEGGIVDDLIVYCIEENKIYKEGKKATGDDTQNAKKSIDAFDFQ